MNDFSSILFVDLFNIDELQQLQDQVATAFGVASIVIKPDGTPITRPSNFTRLCKNLMRGDDNSQIYCKYSDSLIGSQLPDGPVFKPCMCSGLWSAVSKISVEKQHVANWLIGQVRSEVKDENIIREHARNIGADVEEFVKEYNSIPIVTEERFKQIANLVYTIASQLSEKAYNNLQLSKFIDEKRIVEKALLESEQRLKNLFERAPLGYQSLNENGFFIEINEAWSEILGYDKNEVIGNWFGNFLAPEYIEKYKERFAWFKKMGRIHSEFEMICKNGERRFISFEGRIGYKNDGSFDKTHCILQDITEQKHSEIREKEQIENISIILESISDAFVSLDNNWCYTYMNKKAGEIFNRNPQEMIGRNIWEEFPEGMGQVFYHSYYKAVETQEFQFLEEYYPPYDLWFENRIYPSKKGLSIFFHDISERKKSQQKLKEQERQYSSIVGNLPGFVYRCKYDETWTMLYVSEGCYNITGYHPEDFIDNKTISFNEIIKEEFREQLVAQWKEVIANNQRFYQEYEIMTASGETKCVLEQAFVVYDDDHNVKFLEGYIDDISDRKGALLKLEEREETIRLLFNSTAEGIYGIDINGNCTFCNRAALEMLGYKDETDVIGKNMHWLLHHTHNDGTVYKVEDCSVFQAFIDGTRAHTYSEVFWRKNGEKFPVEYWSYPIFREAKIVGAVVTFIDNTEKERLMSNIAKSEGKYRYLFENNPAPMWIFDIETLKFLEVNKAAVHNYGYNKEEFLGLTLKDIRPVQEADELLGKLNTADNLTYSGTWRHKKKNGDIIFVDIVSHEVDFEDKPARLVISTDITARINLQKEIEEERLLLKTLIDNLPTAAYMKNCKGEIIVSNKSNWERFGFKNETQILKKTAIDLYNDDHGIRSFNEDIQIIKTGEGIVNREEVFYMFDGVKRIFLSSKIPLFDGQNKIFGILGVERDITERKLANEQILKLSKSVEQSPTTVIITDKIGNIEYVNTKFSEITGYAKDEVIGKNQRFLNSGQMPEETFKDLWRTIQSDEIWSGDIQNKKKNGDLFWERTLISPLRNEEGEIINYIATKEDITYRKQIEEELYDAKVRAEKSDHLKSAFLANMSHEIRTPLNSIIGFSDLLNDSDYEDSEKMDFIKQININGNNLLKIINDIIDISKIEAGEITIVKEAVNVKDLIETLSSHFFISKGEKSVEFKWKSGLYEEDLFVVADKERLYQIFNNLLSNAKKFTKEGYIEVGYKKQNRFVEFYVKDTGIGIPSKFHDQIFLRFRQVEFSHTKNVGGNGLGLAITKNLIELMGGKIWVESEVGKGTTFFFTIPIDDYKVEDSPNNS